MRGGSRRSRDLQCFDRGLERQVEYDVQISGGSGAKIKQETIPDMGMGMGRGPGPGMGAVRYRTIVVLGDAKVTLSEPAFVVNLTSFASGNCLISLNFHGV